MAHGSRGRLLALASSVTLASACGTGTPPGPRVPRHLVLVTIDTLRADHVGAYGNRDVATPHLDSIAREGAMAPEATAHVPLTRPSHVSLLTGRLPAETGVRDNISPAVLPALPLLAEVLKRNGFATGAFVSSVVLSSASGLDRGFDVYSDEFEGGGGEAQFLGTVQKRGDATTAEAIAWLDKLRGEKGAARRVFLWLHLYDPHDPYEPPEPYASRFAGRPYDGEVAFADELVGRLDEALARLGMRDDTLLVATSDHGEGLGEHGEALHGFFAYQTTLRVPFLARGPGIPAGTRLGATLRLVDVFPTVLELLGVQTPPGPRPGTSLAAALRGAATPSEPVTYAETLVPLLHFGWSDLRVLREGRWKYIQAPRPELYDLATDPAERADRAASEAPRVEAMRAALGRFLDEERRVVTRQGGPAPVELLESLGALGYVGGGGPAETATPGADPKDKIEDFRIANDLIRQGILLQHAKDYAGSVERFQAVLARSIQSFEIHFYLARGLAALGRTDEAARHYEEASRRSPAQVAAWTGLAEARLALGRRDGARAAYETAIGLAPRDARLRFREGELLRDTGDVPGALKRLREAVDLDPKPAEYWNSLGMTLGGNAREGEAESAFREAIKRDATSHRYAYNLGLILERQGRRAEARPWYEKALALDPSFSPAREKLR